MLRTAKSLGILQQLEKNVLSDILGVVGIAQIGVAQPEDQVGIGLHQPPSLRPVQCGSHVCHILSEGNEKRFHPEYD